MKRLIAISDGLWNATNLPWDSNLGLFQRAIKTGPIGGAHQITFADPFQEVVPLAPCGRRIAFLKDSVCALYQQLARNYTPGDTLWFLGYSRGSTVVRSCVGLIRNVGLLKKAHLDKLGDAWHIYGTSWGADARNAERFRRQYSVQPRIKFLGVFDTLGEQGVPAPANAVAEEPDLLRFHDNVLSSAVEFACHALAIDEWRRGFQPCLWRTAGDRAQTEQCWFTGNHKDIGGIQGDLALANITLRWMASRAVALGLAIDRELLDDAMHRRCAEHQEDYSNGRVNKTGTKIRPIGLVNSDETLHPSAEQRFLRNSGYKPANLKAYIQQDDQIQLPL